MKKIKLFAAFLCLLVLSVSCEENASKYSNNTGLPQSLIPGAPTDAVFVNYVNSFNWTNVVGIVNVMRYSHNTWHNGQVETGTSYNVTARTVDVDQHTLKSENYISINGVGLEEIGEGNYYLNTIDQTPSFGINFGTGTNHITLENTFGQEVLNADVSFQTPVTLTSVTPLQNVAISQNQTFYYSPVSDGCISYVTLMKNGSNSDLLKQQSDNGHDGLGIGLGYYTNTGTFSVLSNTLNYIFKPGLFDLTIRKEEFKILTRSDGKKLAVFIQTIDTKTITLVP